jgi:hypothetical protein
MFRYLILFDNFLTFSILLFLYLFTIFFSFVLVILVLLIILTFLLTLSRRGTLVPFLLFKTLLLLT